MKTRWKRIGGQRQLWIDTKRWSIIVFWEGRPRMFATRVVGGRFTF